MSRDYALARLEGAITRLEEGFDRLCRMREAKHNGAREARVPFLNMVIRIDEAIRQCLERALESYDMNLLRAVEHPLVGEFEDFEEWFRSIRKT